MLISKDHQQRWQTSKPGFRRFEIFDEDLVGVEVVKPNIELNKPIFVGASILDLSKTRMYDFWYGVLKVKYEDRIQLCFTGIVNIGQHRISFVIPSALRIIKFLKRVRILVKVYVLSLTYNTYTPSPPPNFLMKPFFQTPIPFCLRYEQKTCTPICWNCETLISIPATTPRIICYIRPPTKVFQAFLK